MFATMAIVLFTDRCPVRQVGPDSMKGICLELKGVCMIAFSEAKVHIIT